MNAISGLPLVSLIARFETAKELLLDSDLPTSRIGGNMKRFVEPGSAGSGFHEAFTSQR